MADSAPPHRHWHYPTGLTQTDASRARRLRYWPPESLQWIAQLKLNHRWRSSGQRQCTAQETWRKYHYRSLNLLLQYPDQNTLHDRASNFLTATGFPDRVWPHQK